MQISSKAMSKEEASAVREFAARLRDRFPGEVESVRLYGSKARRDADADSDIDVIILVRRRTKAFDDATIDLVCDILDEFGVFIETVTMESATYRDAVDTQYPFALNVERDSIAL